MAPQADSGVYSRDDPCGHHGGLAVIMGGLRSSWEGGTLQKMKLSLCPDERCYFSLYNFPSTHNLHRHLTRTSLFSDELA